MPLVVDLSDAEPALRKIGRQLDSNIKDLVRVITLAIDQELVLRTPVDTGLARANWLVQIGSANRTQIAPYRAYPKGFFKGRNAAQGGLNERINANGALRQANAAVSGYNGESLIVISNNVDYIDILDAGRPGLRGEPGSLQAPEGMTKFAIPAGIRTAARSARKILGKGLP